MGKVGPDQVLHQGFRHTLPRGFEPLTFTRERQPTSVPHLAVQVLHSLLMPTTKPRYTITDTGELSEQLDEAQRHWPDVHDRKELLLRLAAAGRDAIEREASERSRAIRQTAGALTGVYRADELKRLREDWPA